MKHSFQNINGCTFEVWEYFHMTHYNGCNCLSILELKFIHVNKRGRGRHHSFASMIRAKYKYDSMAMAGSFAKAEIPLAEKLLMKTWYWSNVYCTCSMYMSVRKVCIQKVDSSMPSDAANKTIICPSFVPVRHKGHYRNQWWITVNWILTIH